MHALGHLEYRVLTTLKGTLPASGMGVVYLSQLAERCAAESSDVEAALSSLAAPLPGKSHGWIVRERNVAWIVNALRYEPTLTPSNGKHRTYLSERLLAPLGKGRPIVDAFKRYYPEWFPGAVPNHPDRPEDGNRIPIDRVSDHSPIQSSPSLPEATADLREPPVTLNGGPGLVGTIVGETMSAAVVLTAAANRAITERWGEQPSPLRYDSATTISAVEQIEKDGVPIAFARDAIYTITLRTSSLERPPKSMNYFPGAVLDRWKAKQAREQAGAIDAIEITTERAGLIAVRPDDLARSAVTKIRGMVETQGTSRFIRKEKVREMGAEVYAAYRAVGGPDRFINADPNQLDFLVKAFASALRAPGASHAS